MIGITLSARTLHLFTAGLLAIGVAALSGCSDDDTITTNDNDMDAEVTDDAEPSDAAVDGAPDASPCLHEGVLGDPCDDDCDCETELACRGLPGEQACSVPCTNYEACQGVDLGCTNDPTCDLNTGACRCWCQEGGCPAGEQCFMGYCVGCATDAHCDTQVCTDPGEDHGVCQQNTETCICGGECGDGVCDGAEAAARTCPADCPGPCVEGELLPYSCPEGTLINWCTCTGGQWDCIDPSTTCPGDTLCRQLGGACVDGPANCWEGEIAADPNGCEGTTPQCCVPTRCYAAGESYDPYWQGACCPGLRALDSIIIMESWDPETPGMMCCSTCIMKACAPCGDGVCQLHFGETTCTCPEDCPFPPFPLVCPDQMPEACGYAYCRQEGTSCHQQIPSCVANQCEYNIQDIQDAICDPVQGLCITP